MSQARFVDPGKERAVLGLIASACFDNIPEASLIPASAFYDEATRIIYRAAISLRQAGKPVIVDTVNAVIEQSRQQTIIEKRMGGAARIMSWEKWWCSEMVDTSLSMCGPRITTWLFEELYGLFRRRRLVSLGERFATGDIEPEEANRVFTDFMPNGSGNGSLPSIVSAYDLCTNEKIVEPVQVISGLLHQGSKMTIGGSSKSFKTWTMLQLAICISAGIDWLGFLTCGNPIVYLNFELPEFAIARRISAICEALGIPYPKNLALMNLRGHACSSEIILPKLEKAIKDNGYVATFLDPIYKLMGQKDENSARDIAQMLNDLERLSITTNSSVVYGQHFSKGNQSQKEALDRISGSGVFARDPDTILTMTKHKEDECFTVDIVLRNLPAQEPIVIKRVHPLMVLANDLDPEEIKQPRSTEGQFQSKFTPDDILKHMDLVRHIHLSVLRKDVMLNTGMSKTQFYRLWRKLVNDGKVIAANEEKDTWRKAF